MNIRYPTACPVCGYSIEKHRYQEKRWISFSHWDLYKPLLKWLGDTPMIECQNCGFIAMKASGSPLSTSFWNGQPSGDRAMCAEELVNIWNNLVDKNVASR
jgi:rubredoxin